MIFFPFFIYGTINRVVIIYSSNVEMINIVDYLLYLRGFPDAEIAAIMSSTKLLISKELLFNISVFERIRHYSKFSFKNSISGSSSGRDKSQ